VPVLHLIKQLRSEQRLHLAQGVGVRPLAQLQRLLDEWECVGGSAGAGRHRQEH
jgi:hypothetical protein